MGRDGVRAPGISGSARREGSMPGEAGYCLGWAESMGYVEAEFLSLAGNAVAPRTGCITCFGYVDPAEEDYQRDGTRTDIRVIAPKMEAEKQRRGERKQR